MPHNYQANQALIRSILRYQKYVDRTGWYYGCLRRLASLRHKFWSVITASDIHCLAGLCPDLALPHPTGVVIHQDAVVGPRCMIMQQVTLGIDASGLAPVLGADVYVGAGAKVLGGIRIGDRVRIGANAVVRINLPDDCTAAGVPARIVRRR